MTQEDVTRTRYTVYRVCWERWESDTGEQYRGLHRPEPVAAFACALEAEDHRRQVEKAARGGVNPFQFIGTAPHE
jgi:hypothetical protein